MFRRTQLIATGLLLLSSVFTPAASAQTVPLATAAARIEQRSKQEGLTRPELYDLTQYPVTDQNERHWRTVLWATATVEPQADYVDRAIAQILSLSNRRLSSPQKRTVEMALQVGTQLYLSNSSQYAAIAQQFSQIVATSNNPEWVAMSLSALMKRSAPGAKIGWRNQVQRRFPGWRRNPYLLATLQEMSGTVSTPPLRDLLNWTIVPGQMQLYVFCPPGRNALCQTLLKDRNGQFVQENGRLWSVPLLARSLHGLSAVFSRGQTPQGIYRIEGTVPQPDTEFFRAYGLFPLIKLFVPYEPGVKAFLPSRRGQLRGGITAYQTLLPPSWRNHFPIQESYWAGRAGRSLFRIHGSGEAPSFFTNNSRYSNSTGWNPAIGCLSALELYDSAGRLSQADMPKILSALSTTGGANFTGYLLVVETPDANNVPLSLSAIGKARN